MNVSAKHMILTAVTIAAVATTGVPVQAGCGGGGGARRGGLSLGVSQSHYGHRLHQTPVQYHAPQQYHAPAYQPASVYQPAPVTYPAPAHQGPAAAPPVVSSQANFSQPNSARSIAAQAAGQPPVQTQQAVNGVSVASQPAANQAKPITASEPTESSALAMLASINQSAAEPSENLIPQFGAASSRSSAQTVAPHFGNWNVSLPGNQSVSLKLSSDSTFTWTATKGGSSSSFNGKYSLDSNRLSLERFSDNQTMVGSWTPNGTGFVFKVDGENSGGLSFTKEKR